MEKEELKNVLDNLTIYEITHFEITYKKNYEYGYGNSTISSISYNKED